MKDKLFLLNFRKFIYIALGWFASVLLHNLVSALLGIEEVVFLIISVFVIPLYFIISLIYSLSKLSRMRKRKS